ncbi:LVIVD repeat-containing protein [Saccharopolyspora griseoalba]|uniref:LVIVD repeat-containing protein n=1 Tax=Saccharopolyspora griseoalba TaxID=1431848 RepID=A0ABW2LN42_9PSEU
MLELRGRRRSRRPLVLGLAAAIAGLALIAPSSAAQPPGDDVQHSNNVQPVANVPRQGPLAESTHSDLAFFKNYAFQGSYDGFTVYDISNPRKPETVTQVACPGGQGDVSVSPDGNLLFMSVDYARTDDTCQSEQGSYQDPNSWEGMRIFDISDKANPKYVKGIKTNCGSHTHTMVPGKSGDDLYLYVSSYNPDPAFPNCQPPHDSISIIDVPAGDPAGAEVVAEPVLFPDGGAPGTAGCHDITVFPNKDLAGGACMGDGALIDISDRVKPKVITTVEDPNFAFYHSATFTNDGKSVLFTDELGGGGAPTCNEQTGPTHGADAIYNITGSGADRKLEFQSYYKIPRHQADTENCVAHNGNLIPIPGRNVYVQSWYQGGVSFFDFTDKTAPKEIGYFDRGPVDENNLVLGGSWSAYYYNGYVYSSDITRGLDVMKISGPGMGQAEQVKLDVLNPQTQYAYPE